MSDRRLIAANGRVAAAHLEGRVVAETYVAGTWRSVCAAVADLRAAPGGARARQLIFGDAFLVLETRDGWAFGQTAKDDYVGYVAARDLAQAPAPTHQVIAPATHLYPAADIKSEAVTMLSFASRLAVVASHERFLELADGRFVPRPHVAPLARGFRDPVAVAERFLGVPYLWGGNSIFGIDCSGLVQVALLACGCKCPADSDMQQAGIGTPIGDNVRLQRGDLLFWKGHVAMAVDADTLIHANAGAMAVALEPVAAAISRIKAQGDGPVTGRKRPDYR